MRLFAVFVFALSSVFTAAMAEVYQTQDAFVAQALSPTLSSSTSQSPKAKALWVTGDLKKATADILQHKPGFLRVKYWRDSSNTARTIWILEEIGKTELITFGIVINNRKIERLRVLEFRESRGWEVKHDFFTNKFIDAQLDADHQLSQSIPNVTGATLSTRASIKVAKLALLFDNHVQQK